MLIEFLKKIYAKASFDTITNSNEEHMSFEDQKAFVDHFPEPSDDFERSYYKYQCWKKHYFAKKKLQLLLFNMGAIVLLPVMGGRLKRNFRSLNNDKTNKYDAVIENVPRLPNTDVIPQEILDSFEHCVEITEMNYLDGILGKQGLALCKDLRRRYFFCFYFRLITTLKIAQFENYLLQFRPEAIIFYSYEREFTGPLQTYLCEQYGSRFISYMHGDVIYSMAFAFQRYSEQYIWGEEYNELFDELRCTFSMKTYTPKKLEGIAVSLPEKECAFYATYYFSDETRGCAEIIRKIFDTFKNRSLRCKIRPHPRYSDMAMLNEVFKGYYIENPRNYSLSESITQSLYIIGLNTTVLSEAYFSGKKVVIDDVSKEGEYQELFKKKYVMLFRPHIKLSELTSQDSAYDSSFRFYESPQEQHCSING
ncbi:MAG: hypothetical protein IKG70_05535 [Lachnospiraceae bacterium]|nr:hypothetical protein [Lachnospiraceae bacterium]